MTPTKIVPMIKGG